MERSRVNWLLRSLLYDRKDKLCAVCFAFLHGFFPRGTMVRSLHFGVPLLSLRKRGIVIKLIKYHGEILGIKLV